MTEEQREGGEPTGGYGAGTGVGNPEVEEGDTENPDWNRTVPDDEAQKTAGRADPDDLGGSETGSGLMAGGDGTAVSEGQDTGGGSPLTEGYVTGGTHEAWLSDVPEAPA